MSLSLLLLLLLLLLLFNNKDVKLETSFFSFFSRAQQPLFFFGQFQPMASTPNNNSLSLD